MAKMPSGWFHNLNIVRRLFPYIVLIAVLTSSSCNKEEKNNQLPSSPPPDTILNLTAYDIIPPGHFPEMQIPEDNKPYVEKIRLGRMLYYDPILSNDGRACATCHHQEKGFTTDAIVNNMPVLPHVNLAWHTNFMWDGSHQGTLEEVMLYEVKDFFATDLNKVNKDEKYRTLFKKYFGVNTITYKELSYALAQFVRTMISRDSRYDRFINGTEQLTYDEMQGRNIFFTEKGDCFHCHVNPIMTDNLFHNTGLDSLYVKEMDKGLFNTTGNYNDLGKFRTPNLRNVALRSRFMHDGRFSTLEEVVEFYNSGVRKVNTLDPIMTKPGKENGLNLTEYEKYQLIQFLKTLTDETFLTDTTLSALQ